MESDLAVALGGFVMMSILRVRIRSASRRETRVEILSWRVQVCDKYDFNLGALAALEVPTARLAEARQLADNLPPGVAEVHENFLGTDQNLVSIEDDYFRELERAGGAHNYDIYSEEFPAPARVPRDFRIRT